MRKDSISLIAAYLLSSMITVLIYAITLHTVDASCFVGLLNSLALVLSGTLFRCRLPGFFAKDHGFPAVQGVIDTPAMIFSGQYTTNQCFFYIALQLAWTAVLYGLCHLLYKSGTREMIVQGG